MNNNTISQNFKYKGNVTIKARRGSKEWVLYTHHNAGGLPIIEFFNKCLIGTYDERLRPKYLAITDDNNVPLLSSFPISKLETTLTRKIAYTFTVPVSSLGSGTIKIDKLYLFCDLYNGTNNWSAQVKLDEVLTIEATSQDALIIEWDLSIVSEEV